MSNPSKQNLVDNIVSYHVADALNDFIVTHGVDLTSDQRRAIASMIVFRLCYRKYNWIELCDVFAWRKRKADMR